MAMLDFVDALQVIGQCQVRASSCFGSTNAKERETQTLLSRPLVQSGFHTYGVHLHGMHAS